MVMPKAGPDLYRWIKARARETNAPLAEDVALNFVRPVIDALSHLHQSGFAHRDVKSENILVQCRYDRGDVQRPVIEQVYLIGTVHTTIPSTRFVHHKCCVNISQHL